MKLFYWILLTIIILLLLMGCTALTGNVYRYPADAHMNVTLPSEILNKKLSAKEVNDRQQDLANYINYLHQYYIAVDLLYKKDKGYKPDVNLPQFKYAQCKVVRDLFKRVDLPPPPKRKAGMSDNDAINVLFDHIEVLRREIRSNNQKMKELRSLYHHCLQ